MTHSKNTAIRICSDSSNEMEHDNGVDVNQNLLISRSVDHTYSYSTSAPVSKSTIFDDPLVLYEIIKNVPVKDWPTLTTVSRQFRNATILAYRNLESLNIYDLYPRQYRKSWTDSLFANFKNAHRLNRILNKLSTDCPNLRNLRGLDCVTRDVSVSNFQKLAKMCRMSSLTSVNIKRCYCDMQNFAYFLKSSSTLDELKISQITWLSPCIKMIDLEDQLRFLGCLTGLKSLTLGYFEKFTGTFLADVNVERLERLNLRYSSFETDRFVQFLQRCFALKSLVLYDYGGKVFGLDSSILENLHNLTYLEKLSFISDGDKKNYTPDQFADAIGKCRNLKSLSIVDRAHDNDDLITNRLIRRIFTGCFELENLRIDLRPASAKTVSYLRNLKNLKSLNVTRYAPERKINPKFVRKLPLLQNLSVLYLDTSGCDWKDLKGLTYLTNLHTLSLIEQCSCAEDTFFLLDFWGKHPKFCRQLVSFELNGESFSEKDVFHVILRFENLKRLTLVFLDGYITNDILKLVRKRCKKLEYFSLFAPEYEDITKKALIRLVKSCENLQELKINNDLMENLVACNAFAPYLNKVRVGYSELII